MRLDTAFLVQSAEVVSDGRVFVHGGGIEGFMTPAVPFTLPSIAIVLRIHFLLEECGVGHQLRVTVTTPDGVDSGLTAVSRLNPQAPQDFAERGVKLFAAINIINLLFAQLGLYTVDVFVDEQRLDGFTIGVAQATPPVEEVR